MCGKCRYHLLFSTTSSEATIIYLTCCSVVIFCCYEPLIFGPGEWILRREHYFINRDWIFLYVYSIFIFVCTGVSTVYNSDIELISIICAENVK